MPTPIERALANADRIIAANRKLEELSVPITIAPPPGVVLKLAEQVRAAMTADALEAGRGESEGTFAPLWRRIWLSAQAYESTDGSLQEEAAAVLISNTALLIELYSQAADVVVASVARKLYFALTGEVRVQPEHLVLEYMQAD